MIFCVLIINTNDDVNKVILEIRNHLHQYSENKSFLMIYTLYESHFIEVLKFIFFLNYT